MSDEKPIGALLEALNLERLSGQRAVVKSRQDFQPVRQRRLKRRQRQPLQGNLFADTSWFPILRGLLESLDNPLGPYALSAYWVVKSNADYKTGLSMTSSAEVARIVPMSERTARDALKKLVQNGLLVSAPSIGCTTVYQVTELLPITDSSGSKCGVMSFDFASQDFTERVKAAARAAATRIAGNNQQHQATLPPIVINIGDVSVNVNVQIIQGDKNAK